MQQHERELVVGAFLDLNLAQWCDAFITSGEPHTIPDGVESQIVTVIEALTDQATGDPSPDSGQQYLQALVLLSDDNLLWCVKTVSGSNPLEV